MYEDDQWYVEGEECCLEDGLDYSIPFKEQKDIGYLLEYMIKDPKMA